MVVAESPEVPEVDEEALKPPLKWAGGKRWLVPHLRPIWEHYRDRRLVEPFAGGLAVTLGLMPERALINDVAPHLIRFYNWIKDDGLLSPEKWGIEGFSLNGSKPPTQAQYYAARARFNELLREDPEGEVAAELFYYLNRTCFNGLCRFNSKGEFNVPIGRYKTINYRRDFTEYQVAFRRWDFRFGDFAALAAEVQPDDFLYLDPPYDTPFTKYAPEDFKWEDQVRLAEWAGKHEGPVVLSNQATDRMIKLYEEQGFLVRFLDAPRMISRTGDRTRAEEILAFHNIPEDVVALSGARTERATPSDHSLEDPETEKGLGRLDG